MQVEADIIQDLAAVFTDQAILAGQVILYQFAQWRFAVPILKQDRPARYPLALLDEIASELGMQPIRVNWPLGDGPGFQGLADRGTRQAHLYERTIRNAKHSPETQLALADWQPRGTLPNEREAIEDAYPGDVVGLPNSGDFAIGDTIASANALRFTPIPRFHPEQFSLLDNSDISKQKQLNKGLRQLDSEGAMQVLHDNNALRREPILAVAGKLQFDVVQARLEDEYGVETCLEPLPFTLARDLISESGEAPEPWAERILTARDTEDRMLGLLASPVQTDFLLCRNPGIRLESFV